jgi:hypothetical protein
VLTNPGPARTCALKLGGSVANIALSQHSVTTLAWS